MWIATDEDGIIYMFANKPNLKKIFENGKESNIWVESGKESKQGYIAYLGNIENEDTVNYLKKAGINPPTFDKSPIEFEVYKKRETIEGGDITLYEHNNISHYYIPKASDPKSMAFYLSNIFVPLVEDNLVDYLDLDYSPSFINSKYHYEIDLDSETISVEKKDIESCMFSGTIEDFKKEYK